MGGSSDSTTIGYRYFMGVHMGIARGPLDELVEIRVGDKVAWSGSVTDDTSLYIDKPDLFGGEKKEGGIQGNLDVFMGKPTQSMPTRISSLLGGRVPGFRGVMTLFYDGLICALNPYPKTWKMRVRRTTKGWDGDPWQPDLAAIWMDDNNIKAMNGAHIIYECATNRQWGRGYPATLIDEASFLAAAQTLYDENFGMCIRWNRQDTLQSFVQSVVDHIGATIYIDRMTGLLRLDLVRGDYDANDLPLFDYSSGLLEVVEADTAARENAVNEIIVTWHDPIENEDRQVRVQNLASIQSLGAVNSQTTEYKGLPTLELATKVAQRDLRITAAALKRYNITLDRRGWRLAPGRVIRISAPDKGIVNAILRIGSVRDGDITEGSVQIEAVIDVFGLPSAVFVAQEENQWSPPDTSAQVVSNRKTREATYRDFVRALSTLELERVTSSQGAVVAMGAKPSPLSLSFDVTTRTASESFVARATGLFCPTLTVSSTIGLYDTTIYFEGGVDIGLIEVGEALQIDDEIMRIDAISINSDGQSGSFSVGRGCVDTLPATHAAGALAFFFDVGNGSDFREYVTGETVDVKMLTKTSTQVLSQSLAPTDSVTIAARQNNPLPPANMTVNGTLYGNVSSVSGAANVVLAWAHRDRLTQLDQLIGHTEASVGPEAGVTYTIRVYRTTGSTTPIRTVTGISGTSWTYTPAMQTSDAMTTNITFEVEAVRDALVSTQKYRFSMART